MPRVGLVLGAGGIAGHAFHVGVLRAIHDATGWDPRTADVIVGTSAGSIVGTGLRAGVSAPDAFARTVGEAVSPEGEAILGSTPPRSRAEWSPVAGGSRSLAPASLPLVARLAASPWRARPGLVFAGLLPPGRLDPSPIGDDVDAVLDAASIDPNPLRVTAVRLSDGRRTVFESGRNAASRAWTWGRAVAASCAIPGVFAPVEIDGELYVDGGAHSPTNADLLAGDDLDLVVVSSPMSSTRSSRHRSLDAPVRAAYRLRLAGELRRLRRRGTRVVTFQPPPEVRRAAGLNAMDPSIRVPVARAAHATAAARLDADPELFRGLLGPGGAAETRARSGAGGR